MNPAPQIKTWSTRHTLHGELIHKVDGHTIKVRIKRDAYDSQSFAVTELWTDAGFKPFTTTAIQTLDIFNWSYVQADNPDWQADMTVDLLNLLAEAKQVLPDAEVSA